MQNRIIMMLVAVMFLIGCKSVQPIAEKWYQEYRDRIKTEPIQPTPQIGPTQEIVSTSNSTISADGEAIAWCHAQGGTWQWKDMPQTATINAGWAFDASGFTGGATLSKEWPSIDYASDGSILLVYKRDEWV